MQVCQRVQWELSMIHITGIYGNRGNYSDLLKTDWLFEIGALLLSLWLTTMDVSLHISIFGYQIPTSLIV